MPYLASFSHDFYEKFGHEGVSELVKWLNQVYDEKREVDLIRRQLDDIQRDLRELRLQLVTWSPP
jgi:hypothetical protein